MKRWRSRVTETRTQSDNGSEAQASETTDEQQTGNGVEQAPEAAASEVEQLRSERDEYLEQLRRTLADFANYKRRNEQERALVRQFANRDLLLQIIDIQDDFERALGAIPEDQRENGWVSGTA